MPSSDDSAAYAAEPGTGQHEPQRMSRRSMLRGAAGAGAAGLAAAALSGVAAGAGRISAESAAAGGTHAEDTADEIVVHVRDARSGDIDVFRGTSQTSLRDRELAARLVRASRA
jgi:hypothetical protein